MKDKKTIFVFIALIPNKDNSEFLAINRSEEELLDADSKWDIPGGKVDYGETPFEAVEREVFEETGYRIKAEQMLPIPHVNYWEYDDFYQHTVVICCLCKLLSSNHEITNDHHVNMVKWIPIKDINKYDTLPGINKFLKQYKKWKTD